MQKVGSLITGALQTAAAAQSPSAAPKPLSSISPKDSDKDLSQERSYSSPITGAKLPSEVSSAVSHADTSKKYADEAPRRMQKFRARSDLLLVKSILSKALARRGLEKKIERYEFILHWKEIVGESLVLVCKPECLSRNTLIVRVINSGWAQEIGFMKPLILQRLSKYLPSGDLVDDIHFRVGPL